MSYRQPPAPVERNGRGHRAYRRRAAALKRRTAAARLPCAWCGGPIDTTLHHLDPMAFTADHPKALAAGGPLIQDLVPMHRKCNASKGAQVLPSIRPAS